MDATTPLSAVPAHVAARLMADDLEMWAALAGEPTWSAKAFQGFLQRRVGWGPSASYLSRMKSGARTTPSWLRKYLYAFMVSKVGPARAELLVWGPSLEWCGLVAVLEPDDDPGSEEVILDALKAGGAVGELQAAVRAASDPIGPGGEIWTAEEKQAVASSRRAALKAVSAVGR